MKHIPFLPLALLTGLACLHPLSALAQDENQKPDDKKDHHQKSDKAAAPAVKTVQVAPATVSHTKKFQSAGAGPSFKKSNIQAVNSQAGTQQTVRGGSRHGVQTQAQFTPPKGNRSNHYGGQWVEADQHADWGNSGEHTWHNHHYRWYDGGWLIINVPVYQSGGSLDSAVQQRLSDQGYYHGPIDGDIGPGSSRAIANYQNDHGLSVTGDINDALVGSLGLQ